MNKYLLKSGLAVMAVSLLFAALAIWNTNLSYPGQNRGRLVFPNTVREGLDLNKIELISGSGTVTLSLEGNYWVVKEADYYFAGIELLNRLFTNINNAAYYHQHTYSESKLKENNLLVPDGKTIRDGEGTLIRTYNNDRVLEEIIIGKTAPSGIYSFARPSGKEEIWLIDGKYTLPAQPYAWLMQPLLDYPPEITEKVEQLGQDTPIMAVRGDKNLPFMTEKGDIVNPAALLERFNFLIAEDVRSAQNFDENHYKNTKTWRLTSFSGLITTVKLYENGREYWIYVTLSTTNLPTAAVNAYIKDNTFLYDGWYFKIPASAGRVLSNYQLK